jgi:hypothetical protein
MDPRTYPEDEDGAYDIESFELRADSDYDEGSEGDEADEASEADMAGERLEAGRLSVLPNDVLALVLAMTVSEPNQQRSLALTCRSFRRLVHKSTFVAQTVATATREARQVLHAAAGVSACARKSAGKPSAKMLQYDTGQYIGQCARGKAHGLGVYSADSTSEEFSGKFSRGREEGLGQMSYANGTHYDGEFHKGHRHGLGVFRFVDIFFCYCRYEGSWSADKRSGFGLIVGGSHRFMFGNFRGGEPVGQHIAWDYDSDEVYLLDFALYTF